MRICISLTGFLRTWEHTKRSFTEQILGNSNHEYHVFVHTYHQNLYEMTAGKQDRWLTRKEIEKMLEGIPVKSLIIEDRDEIFSEVSKAAHKYAHTENFGLSQLESSDKKSVSIPLGVRTFDHLRKLHLSNEDIKRYAEKNNIKYDLVVKTRFDVVYYNTPTWKLFADGHLHCGYGATWGFPEDTFCVATPDLMNKYLGRFTEFDEVFDNVNPKVAGICSHGTLKYVIEKYKMPIGGPAVNILCFRSETSVQYGGNYRFRCDLDWLYDTLTGLNVSDVHQLEAEKNRVMKF